MGGRPPETTDREYLRLFAESSDPVMFTSEVAEAVGVTQQGAYSRLRELAADGLIASKQGRERVWWLTEEGEQIAARQP